MILHPILSIAKKEIMDNIRNKWIIIITIIFAILTLLASYGGSIFSSGWRDLGLTVAAMIIIVQIFISIIGLMLGHTSVVGEIERGSMSSLLALPTKRLEILLGKLIGLGAVITFSILVGFGVGGIVIGLNVPDVNYIEFLSFIASSILIGLVFLSIGIFFSCLFKKRSTAMGGAIFIWFLYNPLVWGFIMAGILLGSGLLENLESFVIPEWYYAIQLINPLQTYSFLVSVNVPSVLAQSEDVGALIGYPDFISNPVLIGVLLAWIVVLFILSYFFFQRKDI